MNETLRKMVEENLFVKIGVAAVDQRTKDINGLDEMIALYLAMNWISTSETTKILAYAKQELAPVEVDK